MNRHLLSFIMVLSISAILDSCINPSGNRRPRRPHVAEDKETEQVAMSKIDAVTDSYEEISGTQATLRDGQVTVAIDKSKVNSLGVISDSEWKISRMSQAVTVMGTPVSVFIDNIGQDCNPILCVLTNDGKVEIMSVFESISTGNFNTSGPLNGFSNIVKFESGATENEYGIGYGTIFAIDSSGTKKEIELWEINGDLYHFETSPQSQGLSMVLLKFTQDWHIFVTYGLFESEMSQQLQGHFWQIQKPESSSPGLYGFEFTDQFDFDLDENYEPKPKSVSIRGEFTFADNNTGVFTVTSTSGEVLAGDINKPCRFTVDSYPTANNSIGVSQSQIRQYAKTYR